MERRGDVAASAWIDGGLPWLFQLPTRIARPCTGCRPRAGRRRRAAWPGVSSLPSV